jgi:hypothetical protein
LWGLREKEKIRRWRCAWTVEFEKRT